MGPKTKNLIKILDEIISLLNDDQEERWNSWMTTCRDRIASSDFSGVEKLLLAYGGMGSFNDLVIGYKMVNGTLQQKKGYGKNNQKLDSLRSKA